MADPRSLRAVLGATLLVLAACTPAAQTAAPSAATPAPTTAPSTAPASVPPSPTPAAFPVTLTDDEGTDVTIPAPPTKIVSLTPATTETLFALGAGNRVVAKVEDIANYPPEAADIEVVATFAGVDVERIVELEADLVVSAGSGLTQGDAVEQLRRAGIPVIVSYPTTVDEGLAGIQLIARAIGASDDGDALVETIKQRLEELAAIAASAATRPRTFYEIDVTGGIFTPPADSIYGEMLRLAGAEPISGDANYSISLEELVAADPEVILLGDAAYGQSPEAVKARAGWGGMTAVKNGAIYPVDDIVVTRPGPRIAEGLYALIVAIHPELADQLPSPAPAPASAASAAGVASVAVSGVAALPKAA
ncbi:MAG TPA: helical backbone metal receptor [Candidatus Binatia bacterium]|nr:helical backbone metal receptor [Candidatus Binatia bacterium]